MSRTTATWLFLVGGVVLAACSPVYIGGARPLDPSRLSTEAGWVAVQPTVEVRQRDASDCGPAALVMLATRWGIALTLDEAVRAVPAPSSRGIRLGDLRVAARRWGLDAYAIPGDGDILKHELRQGRPVIIGLLLRHRLHRVRSHYELVFAFNETTGEIVSVDPAAGFRVRSLADLEDEWEPAGHPALVALGVRAELASD